MADQRIRGYARGIFEMASGEGILERVVDELAALGHAVRPPPALRSSLTDPQLPLERKQGIVDELIGARASTLTMGVVMLLVGQNRITDLADIATALAETAAASRDKVLAEVRSAVPLDPETIDRLAASLSRATGKEVEVRVEVDPSIIGGIVARVGDTVIDGSIARRFDSVRQAVNAR